MRTVVGVLRGGPSSEYDLSLKTGASVLEALDRERYEPRDIFISRGGEWHLHGVAMSPERALRGVDVAFNALHGQFGEDGKIQRILEVLSVPYTGSDAIAASVTFNKEKAKRKIAALGLKVPHGVVVDNGKITDLEKTALNIFRSLPHPVIVKPVTGGSSLGANLADSFHGLQFALEEAFKYSPKALVEEYIRGKEATVGVIDEYRSEKLYALMPAEIELPSAGSFYDYDAKHGSDAITHVPARFSRDTKQELQRAAKLAHEGLGLRHFSRSDFIVSKRGIYYLETDAVSDLTKDSEFSHMLRAVGAKLSDFIDHVIGLAKRAA